MEKKDERKKIEALTPEQEGRLGEYYEKWLALGLQTGKQDRKAIEGAICEAYECAGLSPPKTFVWGASPKAVALMVDAATHSKSGDPSNACYGTQDAAWLGFYAFMREVLNLEEETEELVGLTKVVHHGGGWFWPFEYACFCSELPTCIRMDAEGRLHAEDGPAVAYSDGEEIYAWRDVLVPREVIMAPQALTPKRILDETNAEVRRVMLERYGADQFIIGLGLRPIHEDEFGKLYRVELANDPEPLVMVEVICPSTGRVYFNRVRPDVTTARAAVASRWGLTAEEYNPEVEG